VIKYSNATVRCPDCTEYEKPIIGCRPNRVIKKWKKKRPSYSDPNQSVHDQRFPPQINNLPQTNKVPPWKSEKETNTLIEKSFKFNDPWSGTRYVIATINRKNVRRSKIEGHFVKKTIIGVQLRGTIIRLIS